MGGGLFECDHQDEAGQVLSDLTSTTRIPRDTSTQQLRLNHWTTGANKSEHKNADVDEMIFNDYDYCPRIGAILPVPEADAPTVESGAVPPATSPEAGPLETGTPEVQPGPSCATLRRRRARRTRPLRKNKNRSSEKSSGEDTFARLWRGIRNFFGF